MIKLNLKKIVPLAVSLLILFTMIPEVACGFSLGKIKVSSRLGDAFYAEIPVRLDGKYPFSSTVGSIQDYERLGLERDTIIDKMAISLAVLSDKEVVIRLSSSERILKPSVNILIKASHNGGTILENYLIAVDYGKSLSLSIPIKEDNKDKTDLLPQEDIFTDKAEPKLDIPLIEDKAEPAAKAKTEVAPQVNKREAAPILKREPNVVKVRRGDNLYKIAYKIGATKDNVEQVVVAIWMLNADSFEHKNMNYLLKGMSLKVDGAIEKGKTILKGEAGRIIRAQWRETLHVRSSIFLEEVGVSQIYSLPIERLKENEREIYDLVLAWKDSWGAGDIEGHISFYSKKFRNLNHRYNSWIAFKRRFTKKHGTFKIDIGKVQIQWMGKLIIVSFPQHFRSKLMNSVGRKILYLVKEEGVFKVVGEVWKRELSEEGYYPFVVEVASHSFDKNVLKKINDFRRDGYSLYNILWVDTGKRYYKIFIDRFSTKIEASIFANKLLKKRSADYAFPLRLPYSVEVGTLDNRDDAISTIKLLRNKGFTSYPLVNCSSNGCNYKVLVGAFKNSRGALYLSNKLKSAGIESSVVTP